jgi:hypothetical protein
VPTKIFLKKTAQNKQLFCFLEINQQIQTIFKNSAKNSAQQTILKFNFHDQRIL